MGYVAKKGNAADGEMLSEAQMEDIVYKIVSFASDRNWVSQITHPSRLPQLMNLVSCVVYMLDTNCYNATGISFTGGNYRKQGDYPEPVEMFEVIQDALCMVSRDALAGPFENLTLEDSYHLDGFLVGLGAKKYEDVLRFAKFEPACHYAESGYPIVFGSGMPEL